MVHGTVTIEAAQGPEEQRRAIVAAEVQKLRKAGYDVSAKQAEVTR